MENDHAGSLDAERDNARLAQYSHAAYPGMGYIHHPEG